MLDNDLQQLRAVAYDHLLAADRPLASQALARLLFGPGRHEDPVAEVVLRRLLRQDQRFVATPDGRWCAQGASHLRRPLADLTYAVIDLETTGSVLGVDEIIELGLTVMRRAEVTRRFSSLVRTTLPLPPWVRRLTGIRTRELRSAPTFDELMPDLQSLLEDTIFVAHDLRFDLPFLRWEFTRHGGVMPDLLGLCTLRLAQQLWPDLASWRLSSLAEHFGHAHLHPHRAADDAAVTALVLSQILRRASQLGLLELGELLALGADGPLVPSVPVPALLAAEVVG